MQKSPSPEAATIIFSSTLGWKKISLTNSSKFFASITVDHVGPPKTVKIYSMIIRSQQLPYIEKTSPSTCFCLLSHSLMVPSSSPDANKFSVNGFTL